MFLVRPVETETINRILQKLTLPEILPQVKCKYTFFLTYVNCPSDSTVTLADESTVTSLTCHIM